MDTTMGYHYYVLSFGELPREFMRESTYERHSLDGLAESGDFLNLKGYPEIYTSWRENGGNDSCIIPVLSRPDDHVEGVCFCLNRIVGDAWAADWLVRTRRPIDDASVDRAVRRLFFGISSTTPVKLSSACLLDIITLFDDGDSALLPWPLRLAFRAAKWFRRRSSAVRSNPTLQKAYFHPPELTCPTIWVDGHD